MIHGRIMDHHYLKVIFIIFLTCTIKPMISDIRWSAILKVAICHNENWSSFISSQKVTINNFKVAKEHECIDFTASFLIDIFLTLLFLIMLSKISRKVTKFFLSGQKWYRHFELSSKVSHAKSIDIHVLMTLCTYLRILF